jgi:hypothetical protein
MVRGRGMGGSELVEVDECERKMNWMVNVSGNRQQLSGVWVTSYTNYKRRLDSMSCSSTIVSMAMANDPTGVAKDEKFTRGLLLQARQNDFGNLIRAVRARDSETSEQDKALNHKRQELASRFWHLGDWSYVGLDKHGNGWLRNSDC